MRTLWIATLLVSLLACDDDDAPTDPCAARLDGVATRLSEAAAVAEPAGAPLEVPLPRVERGRPVGERLPVLVVGADDVRLGDRVVGGGDDVERLARTLASDLRGLEAAREGDLRRVALWVDPTVDVHRLSRILSLAPRDVRFVLLTRGPAAADVDGAPEWVEEALAAPPLPVVDEDREEGVFAREDNPDDPLARRDRIERAWERATARCAGARMHLPSAGALAQAGPALGPPSVEPLMAALRECGCGADVAAIEALARAALVSPEGPVWRAAPDARFGLPTDEGQELPLAGADVAQLAVRLGEIDAATVWIRAE